MLPSIQSAKGPNGVEATPNASIVREQLRRLLAHPLFTHSKRYPVLLAYTVEQALAGNAGELKERTIGVEAFGRQPSYDVNLDPIVRMTAAEVRKRLTQYYYNPDHANELVIELQVGSYVPSFHEPKARALTLEASSAGAQMGDHARSEILASASLREDPARMQSLRSKSHWIPIAIALLVAVLLGFGAGRVKLPSQPTPIERFWKPITATSSQVTYCLGEPVSNTDQAPITRGGVLFYGGLDVYDVTTLARSIIPLVPRNGSLRVLPASATGFAQLREGPFVLIGALDNQWTMRITQDLPYGFETDERGGKIVDRKSNPKRSWSLQWQVAGVKLSQDYAVVARIHDNVTGQPVIILGGILGEGTEAASEVVSNPVYLNQLLEKLPRNWDQLNLEAVIGTQVIDGHPGPPTIIAVQTW